MSLRDGRRAVLRALASAGILGACAASPAAVAPGPDRDHRPNQLIVGYHAAASPADREYLRRAAGVEAPEVLFDDTERWRLPPGTDPVALSDRLRGLVRYAQPNWIRRLVGLTRRVQAFSASEFDPRDNILWHLALLQAARSWNVDRPGTLRQFGTDNPPGKGVLVAVVDSGVDIRHPDLAGNITKDLEGKPIFYDEIKDTGGSDLLAQNDSTRIVYDYETAYTGETHPGPDGNGHGTHVAGIIAGIGNNAPEVPCKEPTCNTVGVGPGIAILPVKTMNWLGDGDDFRIARGLRDAADRGARVINLSVGGPQPGPALEEAIEFLTAKGSLLVVASGNDGLRVNYPAAYAGAIAVGAIGHPEDPAFPDALARSAPYSSRGPELDLVAPGGSDTEACPENRCGVYSTIPTYPTNVTRTGKVSGTGYGRLTGTSMATPQVSATAALIWSREPGLSPRQVRQRLIGTAAPVTGTDGSFSDRYGYGLLDPYRALSQVSHDGS